VRIGIDMDGVFCDYVGGYNALVKQELGMDLPYPAPTWAWHRDAGVTEEQEKRLADIIHTSPWQGMLLPLPGAIEALERLNTLSLGGNDIYFITNRGGKLAKFWAEMWLKFHGYDTPAVLIAKEKGAVAKGLQLDVFVDDYPPNTLAVIEALGRNPDVRVYLPRHPYNEYAWSQPFNYGTPVKDINEVLEREFPQSERRAA
jgi:hypothetical protein